MNDLRKWIRLVEAEPNQIDEAVEIIGDPPYRVLRNPTAAAVANLAKQSHDHIIKGLYEPSTKTVYVWDAYKGSHSMAADDLGLPENSIISFVGGLNNKGQMALYVCDHDFETIVKEHPSFRKIKFGDFDSDLDKRWR